MSIEYLGLSSINGPLIALEGVQDAFYDEIVEFVVDGTERKIGRIVEIYEDKAVIQVFEGSENMSLKNSNKKDDNKNTTIVTAPARAKIKTLKNVKKRKMQIKLAKVSGAKGYQIRYCDNKKFQGYSVKNIKKTTVTIKKLDKKETYWVKARAYKVVNGSKKYGAWSRVKKVKIKK